VSPRVVCDHPMPRAFQQLRSVDDVPPRRGQPVGEHDRGSVAGLIESQLDLFELDCQRDLDSPSSVDQISSLVRTRATTSSVNSELEAWPPMSGVRMLAALASNTAS
jgi:hypothetical protein